MPCPPGQEQFWIENPVLVLAGQSGSAGRTLRHLRVNIPLAELMVRGRYLKGAATIVECESGAESIEVVVAPVPTQLDGACEVRRGNAECGNAGMWNPEFTPWQVSPLDNSS